MNEVRALSSIMQQSGEALGLPGRLGIEEDRAVGAVVPTGSFF